MFRVFSLLNSPSANVGQQEPSLDIEAVKAAELDLILGRKPDTPQQEPEPWGLALSGGGIRSATFSLGVLQSLARNDLLRCFHYQSTVSGGGYIGAFLQGLIHSVGYEATFKILSAKLSDRAQAHEAGAASRLDPIQHLREYSNYLSPRKSPVSGDTLGMVGTYVRNVLLIQLQLCALILALSLMPLLLYRATYWTINDHRVMAVWVAGLFGLAGCLMLGYVSKSVERRTPGPDAERAALDWRVLAAAFGTILSLALGSFVGAVGLANFARLPSGLDTLFDAVSIPGNGGMRLGFATAMLYPLPWLAWVAWDYFHASRRDSKDSMDPTQSALRSHRLRFVFAAFSTAMFAGIAMVATHSIVVWLANRSSADEGQWGVMIIAPVIVMAGVTLTGIIHLGLAGPALTDLQREIWARVGGKTAGVVVLWYGLPLGLAVLGPWALCHLMDVATRWGWAGILTWASTTGIGLLAAHSKLIGKDGDTSRRAWVLDRIARIAPWVFILGLIVGLSLVGQALVGSVSGSARPAVDATLSEYLTWIHKMAFGQAGAVALVVAASVAVWALFGWAVNVNEFSLNAFYRNRLVRCYLGASNKTRNPEPTTDFDLRDDIRLSDVTATQRWMGCRPLYPLVCTALNLVAAKQLDWQDRKAASFVLAPLFSGYLPPASRAGARQVGDRLLSAEGALADSITLGSATAISGAAVNPNMGYHSSPAVTFLLTLFDARLGWWLPNPNHGDKPSPSSKPFFGFWLISEMLGLTHDGGKYVHLSDGGHFENLGIYELVRRRCRFILSVDASADPHCDFASLGSAVQKCRVDLGASIEIDTSALKPCANGRATRSCTVGCITYADGSQGVLLYMKPSLLGNEPSDILHYATCNASFPHEPTSDQYFDETQFESYRRLGEVIATHAVQPALERARRAVDLSGEKGQSKLGILDSDIKEKFLLELRHHWIAPLPRVNQHFSRHAQAMSQLFTKLRQAPELAVLDAQIHPAWTGLVAATEGAVPVKPENATERLTQLPEARDFRSCFYFCQDLIQMMESVYHDLDLENDWEHPDNRGWMNAFRHWSWAPMFRIAWAIGAPTFGARFIAFCEMRLDLPVLNIGGNERRPLRVMDVKRAKDEPWDVLCKRLLAEGRINHVEHGVLVSEALAGASPTSLHLLCIRWDKVLARTTAKIPNTTLGVAVLKGDTLRLLRIQDHVRRLGFGTEFMRLLTSTHSIGAVDVRGGHYGAVGALHTHQAREITTYLSGILARVRRLAQAHSDASRMARAASVDDAAVGPEPP